MIAVYTNFAVIAVYTNILVSPIGRTAPRTPARHGTGRAHRDSGTSGGRLAEAAGHLDRLAELITAGRVTGPKIHDARIAASCLDHGIDELWSTDRDFSRFPTLRVRNPLVNPRRTGR